MIDADDIEQQQKLLTAHRHTLAHLLTQQAQFSAGHIPAHIANGIADTHSEIARIKAGLRASGFTVDDQPGDTITSADQTVARELHPGDIVFGDKVLGDIIQGNKIIYMADEQRSQIRAAERELRLRACLADHSSFISNRLACFVGRTQELAEIRQRIAELLPSGGYVTITGQAGQGKSSVLAKLVDEFGSDNVAHHFIPFNPGPDHQVSLIRDLMARLLLKYELPEIYIASDSRPALRDYFATVLRQVARQGQQEVIFLDGLDQLIEDANSLRDISFLPNSLPPGIVFVLGTRPNDTLRPLALLNPHIEYQLPNLSRPDFDLILRHRGVALASDLANRFYTTMQENALYLDLIACELSTAGVSHLDQIIQRIAANPDNLYSLAMDRFKRHRQQWREVIKPILGVLLAAREPLPLRALRALIDQEADATREGLERLGGLVASVDIDCYALYHLKFQNYLRQDQQRPNKEYIFATDEEETWHQRITEWCEGGIGGINAIWQDAHTDVSEHERRAYARLHYVAHLAIAKDWHRLWDVLDAGAYGRAKLQLDPSTRSFVQDLDLVRQAAITATNGEYESGIELLPRLWRYSLLRCNLASQVDNYPDALFETLVLVGRAHEAIRLAELLTDAQRKATILLHIMLQLSRQAGQEQECGQLLMRATEVARVIQDTYRRDETLSALAKILAQANQHRHAIALVHIIERTDARAKIVEYIAQLLAQTEQTADTLVLWDEVATLASTLEGASTSGMAQGNVAQAFARAGHFDRAISLAHTIESASHRARGLGLVALALAQVDRHTDAQVLWQEVDTLIHTIAGSGNRTWALWQVALALAQAGQPANALLLCEEALVCARDMEENDFLRDFRLVHVLDTFAQTGHSDKAIVLIGIIQDASHRARALECIALVLAQTGHSDRAIAVVSAIEAPWLSMANLDEIVIALAQAGQFAQAIALAHTIEDASERARALRQIALVFAQVGQFDQAIALAHTIERTVRRAEALGKIALVIAQTGQFDQAIALAHTIESTSRRAETLGEIALALALADQPADALPVYDEAIMFARTTENANAYANALGQIAKTLAQAYQFDQAIALANTIEDVGQRASGLGEIARLLTQNNQSASALPLLREAATLARTIADSTKRDATMGEVALAFAHIRDYKQALALAHTIKDVVEQCRVLSEVAQVLAQYGQLASALRIFNEAATLARTILDVHTRCRILEEIVLALARANQYEHALFITSTIVYPWTRASAQAEIAKALAHADQFDQAIVLARTVEDVDRRAEALCEIALALIQTGRIADAFPLFDEAISLARTLESPDQRDATLREIALALAQVSQHEQSLALVRTIESAWWRAYALGDIAQVHAEKGQSTDALRLCDEAITLARTIEEADHRAYALNMIAQVLAQINQSSSALAMWEEATSSAHLVEDNQQRAHCLEVIALALVEVGQYEQATALAYTIKDSDRRVKILEAIAQVCAAAHHQTQLLELIQTSWLRATAQDELLALVTIANPLVRSHPNLGIALANQFTWAIAFLKQ